MINCIIDVFSGQLKSFAKSSGKADWRGLKALALLLLLVAMTSRAPGAFARSQPKAQTLSPMAAANNAAWKKIANTDCATVNDACAHAAIVEASTECANAARSFRKDTKKWQWIGFGLLIVSAASTAVGASATIANAKVWSTLGGTTGLGAVSTTVTANQSTDQTGLNSVNATILKFQTFLQGSGGAVPTAQAIYNQAPTYGAACTAAAEASGSPK